MTCGLSLGYPHSCHVDRQTAVFRIWPTSARPVGALLLTWLLFNVVVFSVFGSAGVFFLLLSWVIWDGVRQTTPESLAARGATLNDDAVLIMDPGLRREFAPFVPFAGRAPAARRSRVRAVSPPRRSRPPAAPPPPLSRPPGADALVGGAKRCSPTPLSPSKPNGRHRASMTCSPRSTASSSGSPR